MKPYLAMELKIFGLGSYFYAYYKINLLRLNHKKTL